MTSGAEPLPAVGMRVRLRPSRRADIVDIALAGRLAEVDGVEYGADGRVYVLVSLVGDTAADLGRMSQLGHRFFFDPDELEAVSDAGEHRVLIAGLNDAVKPGECEVRRVVEHLRGCDLPPGVRVADFGVRGQDLARALEEFDAAVVLRAGPIGEVSCIGLADLPSTQPLPPAHRCGQVIVVGCGDAERGEPDCGTRIAGVVLSVVDDVLAGRPIRESSAGEGVVSDRVRGHA
ncbi:hypothetical protein [Saccharopolyspora elongata]|uniref:Uncharacterized protein n=1 Tax=Saccharopolyspora elongata TaxID=2530387 RepID=A0A4R4YTE3_9PSEU|nr:hypothetical protein [Saccharopolyspora elongata]TDD48581.1 hypothetical protein E1288_21625 [Saccharopolyspora elongata]